MFGKAGGGITLNVDREYMKIRKMNDLLSAQVTAIQPIDLTASQSRYMTAQKVVFTTVLEFLWSYSYLKWKRRKIATQNIYEKNDEAT